MKRVALLLIICLLLSGCGTYMDGEFIWEQTHPIAPAPDSGQNISVADYQQLCAALTDCVEAGIERRTLSVGMYDRESLEQDISRAIESVCTENPVAAFAVQQISYELGTGGGEAVLSLQVQYSHDRNEIKRIISVQDNAAAMQELYKALNVCDSGIVVRIAAFEAVDFVQVVEDYALAHPEFVMEIPQLTVNIYPEIGQDRVVELKFTYQTSRDTLRGMQIQVRKLFDASVDMVSVTQDSTEKYSQMYALLLERFQKYTFETSITPAYSLLVHGVGDTKAFATVYAAMCREAGLECLVVTGTRAGEPWCWNIVQTDDGYYHLDLLRAKEEGAFSLLTDSIIDEGYVWDFTAFPECKEPVQDEIEPDIPPAE